MTHKFNPANIGKLDNPERKKILPPEEILLRTGLKAGDTMADIGAGSGYFSLPASGITGENGRVISIDPSMEMIQILKQRVSGSNAKNIEIVHSEEYDLKAGKNISDFALISMVLHEIEDKTRFLIAVYNLMKPKSRLTIIEWIDKPMEMGPPVHDRIKTRDAIKLLEQAGFVDIKSFEYNDCFYFITASKP